MFGGLICCSALSEREKYPESVLPLLCGLSRLRDWSLSCPLFSLSLSASLCLMVCGPPYFQTTPGLCEGSVLTNCGLSAAGLAPTLGTIRMGTFIGPAEGSSPNTSESELYFCPIFPSIPRSASGE